MKHYHAASIFFLATLMALIQPCPAPPPLLAIIPEAAEAGVIAGDASATAGEAGTAAAEGGAAAGEAAAPTAADAMSADGGLLSNLIQDSSILEVLNARVGSDVTTDANAASEASSILQTIKNAGVAVTSDEIASIPTGPGFTAAGDEGSTGSLASDVPESAVPSQRNISSRGGATSANGLGACITDGTNTKQHYDLSKADAGRVVVAGLPPLCMAEIQEWNAHPLIGQLAVVQGNMTVVNGSAVEIDGLPDYPVNAFKAKIARGGTGFGSGKM